MANSITLNVYKISNQVMVTPILIGFPAGLILVVESVIVINGVTINSNIYYDGYIYSVAETVAQITALTNDFTSAEVVILKQIAAAYSTP